MAERRMFAKTIIDSDAFLDMPLSSQCLYFHLSMRADDDGFINNPKKIQRMIGGSDDDFKILLAKNFLIPFESGVCVIKHWKLHNYIQRDRYKETVYIEEKQELFEKENGVYTRCIQDVYSLEAQVSIGKSKDSIVKSKDISASADNEFEKFWKIYNKSKDKPKTLKKWNTLKKDEKEKILIVVEDYVKSTPDKQYRKNPLTWLNGKCWDDEIVVNDNKNENVNKDVFRRFLEKED